jgi:hypothetical protein
MIKQVRIQNYKSLDDVDVSLDPVTVLIGRSGTGKSNFVEALRFLRDYVAVPPRVSIFHSPDVFPAYASGPVNLSFDLIFSAPDSEDEYQYLLTFCVPRPFVGSGRLYEEKLARGDRTVFHQREGKWLDAPTELQSPLAETSMLGRLAGIPDVAVAHLALSSGLGFYAFPDNVATEPPHPASSITMGFSERGENYDAALLAIKGPVFPGDEWKNLLAALQRLDSSIMNLGYGMPHADDLNSIVRRRGGMSLIVNLRQESQGLRRLLAHLIALYQKPSKQTLIFEEPEKGLHPGALAVLADQFLACPAAGRGQVILTTQSPELLDHFPPESLRGVEMRDFVTHIGRISAGQLEAIREQLLRPGELLTVDSPQLESATAK